MKVCCVFNYPPLYRFPIYKEMAEQFDCDFYFGDTVFEPLKKFDVTELKGFKKYIHAKRTKFKAFVWHSGIASIFSLKYTHYIVTGDASMIVNWFIIIFATIFRKKIYLWCHGEKTYIRKKTTLIMLKAFYRNVTGILMYNHYNCRFMEALGINPDRLYVIHNSLDTQLQTKYYSLLSTTDIYKQHFGNDYPTLIYIGRIQRVKKTELILEAMHLLQQKGYKLNLVVIGENVNDTKFGKKLIEYKLEKNIWMYGPCFDEAKNSELIYNAAVCVSPGNVGLTCIHVLSYGTPVITNGNFAKQMPEYEAIIEGKTGDFFKEDNVQQLAEKIEYWTSLSDEQRNECRKNARKTITQEWSVEYQMSLLKRLLN